MYLDDYDMHYSLAFRNSLFVAKVVDYGQKKQKKQPKRFLEMHNQIITSHPYHTFLQIKKP